MHTIFFTIFSFFAVKSTKNLCAEKCKVVRLYLTETHSSSISLKEMNNTEKEMIDQILNDVYENSWLEGEVAWEITKKKENIDYLNNLCQLLF